MSSKKNQVFVSEQCLFLCIPIQSGRQCQEKIVYFIGTRDSWSSKEGLNFWLPV
jgi:hypothetical protein